MKKINSIIGRICIVVGVIFFLIHSFVVVKGPTESFSRDLFGFIIPMPPTWASFIPYLGFVIGIIFEFFSMHGLVGIIISMMLFGLGAILIGKGEV